MDSGMSERVYRGLFDKIAEGTYPQGSMLPSCRQLAGELGVNKNTVNKAFRALVSDGLVGTVPGVGMVVVKRPDVTQMSAQLDFGSAMDKLLRDARASGITLGVAERTFRHCVSRWYTGLRIHALLLECNVHDAASLASFLEKQTAVATTPCLIDDFLKEPEAYISRYDMIVTTFYHLAEIYSHVPQADASKVMAVSDKASMGCLLTLSRLPKDTRVGIVAGHSRTIEQIKVTLESCGKKAHASAVIGDIPGVTDLLSKVDAVLVSMRCRSELDRLNPRVPVHTISFEVDQQSMEFLRTAASSLIDRKVVGTVAASH